MGRFQELKVWQRAKEFAVFIYKLTEQGSFAKDYGLRDQIRRAVVSIPSNIAEGDELDTNRQAIRFFYTAKGSSAEVLTQAIIAFEIGYITKEHFDHIQKESKAISSMLTRLIQIRSSNIKNPKP
ncbi:MAG: four helix bundle protein [Thermodesulfobacteriota bacterium]|nr:four helix bundle protein [Thermodesulfobacteriota bacterium]